MTSRTIDLRLEEKKNCIELFFNNKSYTTQRNLSDCFAFLLQDYFIDIFKEINLKSLNKIEFYDSNIRYYKEYKEGYLIYIESGIHFSDLKNIFKSIQYDLKETHSKNFVLECKRKLVEVSSHFPPALYYSNIEESWFIISGSEVNIKIEKQINLEFDILWTQIRTQPVKIEKDENSYYVGKSYEHLIIEDEDNDEDEDEDEEQEDIRIKLF